MLSTNPLSDIQSNPTVSIVTIVKNHAEGLKITLDSVSEQDFKEWKLIMVVGSSTDSTIAIAQSFADKVDRARLVHQLDSGIYEAMNLGTQNVDPDSQYVIFMNAGDRFNETTALSRLVSSIKIQNCGVVVGGYKIDKGKVFPQKEGILSELRFAFTPRGGCHQSMIYSTRSIEAVGAYNLDFPIAADHELTLRVLRSFGGWRISDITSIVEGNGFSDNNLIQLHSEKQVIRKNHFGKWSWITIIGHLWKLLFVIKIKLNRFHFLKTEGA